ncbi:MAG: cytochrome b N-terminal domain-containing protein [Candidatus Tectomicrobia bacterium]|uniref:Cytochrome b N-terminal domain-containing protein n=1 Tax=Tectimicrobiota bacterium TaxID=2528274 RepID=A0A932GQR8_UNCTE|nr:cytochrome b N-terminal domain-containing protein [Candidatus Tectomicrobia bacterium]
MTEGEHFKEKLFRSQLWRSVFRHPYPRSPREERRRSRTNFFLHLHPPVIERERLKISQTWGLGGISFLLFLILAFSGGLLMFYYRPSVEHAYHDMKDLEYVVSFGPFLRNLHRWAAHAMVITVIAHMARVFYAGSYRPPRELNWVVGISLLVFTLLLSFTGYLLPWDQLAYWAVTVATHMVRAAPLIGADGPLTLVRSGGDLSALLLGARTVSAPSLLRFYVLHVFLLPLAMAALIAFHFWRVRKDRMIRKPL